MPRLEHAEHHASLASTSSNRFPARALTPNYPARVLNFKCTTCFDFELTPSDIIHCQIEACSTHVIIISSEIPFCPFEELNHLFQTCNPRCVFREHIISFRFELHGSTSNRRHQNLQLTKCPFKICISNPFLRNTYFKHTLKILM